MPFSAKRLPQLEGTARRFAAMAADEADAIIAAEADDALRHWRMVEARFWQGVRVRAQMIRSTNTPLGPRPDEEARP